MAATLFGQVELPKGKVTLMFSRIAITTVLLAATSAFAQTAEPVYVPPVIELAPQRKLAVFKSEGSRGVTSEANVSGTQGELILDTAGSVLLRSIGAIPIVFETNGVERGRIHSDGNMTLGALNNLGRLALISSADNGRALYMQQRAPIEANTNQTDFGVYIDALSPTSPGVTNEGTLIGAQVQAWHTGTGILRNAQGIRFFAGNLSTGTITNAWGMQVNIVSATGTITNGYGVYINDVPATSDYGIYQAGVNDTNYFGGDVGIGTASPTAKLHVVGNIVATGSITGASVIGATYQDLAEWVPASVDMTPGTVVVLNSERNNEVRPSSNAYDTAVAGVVSRQPGIILGVGADSSEMIATTGRVKVHVTAANGPIRVGDLLSTSDKAGVAMKSLPIDLAGTKIHRPGTLIGKALEPLESGEGEILVLLSLQ